MHTLKHTHTCTHTHTHMHAYTNRVSHKHTHINTEHNKLGAHNYNLDIYKVLGSLEALIHADLTQLNSKRVRNKCKSRNFKKPDMASGLNC